MTPSDTQNLRPLLASGTSGEGPRLRMLKQQARTIAALLYAADLSVTLATLPVAYALRSALLPRLFSRLTPL